VPSLAPGVICPALFSFLKGHGMATREKQLLSRRVLVKVHRGLTDNTPTIVFQHEIPILEAIHGEGQVADVTEEATKSMNEGFKPRRGDRGKLKPSVAVGLGEVFCGDHRQEFARLELLYGRHPSIDVSWVENVYGRFQDGKFSAVLGAATLEDMGIRQLRQRCTEEDLKYEPHDTPEQLIKLLQDAPAIALE
jgi:hypothetical protein